MLPNSRVFTLFLILIPCAASKEKDKHPLPQNLKCQHFRSVDNRYPPRVWHRVVNDWELAEYDEVMVIGDVHGNFDEFQLLLEHANVSSDNVLKVLTGDLTRGGPKNLEVINFITNSSSIISVRGNNDEKTLQNYHGNRSSYGIHNMDFWVRYLRPHQVEFLTQLPYTISIPSLNLIVMHAGLIPNITLNKSQPYDIMNLRTLIPAPHCPSGYAPSRNITDDGEPWAKLWDGPEKIVFGHDHKRMLQVYPKAIGIDTSCDRGYYMTGYFVMGPREGHFVHQPALNKHYKPKKGDITTRNKDLLKGHGRYEEISASKPLL